MKLQEFRERRARVLDVLRYVEPHARVFPGDVTIRETPTRDPGVTTFTVTRTDDGTWRGDSWYSEAASTHSIEEVTSATLEKALDWVWWSCTADYRRKFVVRSESQHDRKTRRILRDLLDMTNFGSEMRKRMQEGACPQWSDESTNSLLLGLAALALARSPSPTAMRLARNPHTPPGALATLAAYGVPAVRWQVAGNPAARTKTLNGLRASGEFGVRWYLAQRDDTQTSDIVAWAFEDPALWTAVLDRPDLAAVDLDDLDQASSGVLRSRIIEHPAASPELLGRFASESDVWTGIPLLERGRLEPHSLEVVFDRAEGLE